MQDEMTFEELMQIVSVCMDEIERLQKENSVLNAKINELSTAFSRMMDNWEKWNADYEDTKQNIATSLRIQDRGLDNMIYELNDPQMDRSAMCYPRFFEVDETIRRIVEDGCSLARFGDGEFAIMANHSRQKFQNDDPKLAERLKEVLNVQDDRFLVAIADNYGSLAAYSRAGKSGIRLYMTEETRKEHMQFLDADRIYHNTYISRPCVLYKDYNTDGPRKRFDKLKKIWQDKDIVIVEGMQTRLGVGNDLFDNAKSIRRVLGPAENAFAKYDLILKSALEQGASDRMYLIALGPTAGVLAYDLFCQGYQAIDIGHIDLEYEWYLRGGKRCAIPGKYNNEVYGGEIVEPIEDDAYNKQIVSIVDA